MAKQIPATNRQAFIEFIDEMIAEDITEFCLDALTESEVIPSDHTGWEFHARNYKPDSYDLYDLFDSHPDYKVEIHGHDDFVIAPR